MTITLEWNDEQDKHPISEQLVQKLELILQEAAAMEEYRGIDRPTDVLSFALNESTDEELDILYEVEDESELAGIGDMLGDIIISTERAQLQADDYGHSWEREVGFLFVHGFLHLIGYDHQDEESERIIHFGQR